MQKFDKDDYRLLIELSERVKEIEDLREEMKEIKERIKYFDGLAVRMGTLGMGVLSLSAMLTMGAEKVKDKLLSLLFQ